MKTKPKRHKAQNTFKFQTFSDRISSIDIDVFHKVKHPYEEDEEENETYYTNCLKKTDNDNFSPDYIELSKKLPHDIYSLALLLAQKNKIMDILINHLKSCEMESLQSTLELIVAVAKDLGKEFFPFFNPTVIRECVRLLDSREPDQIEIVFTCLAYLFKYLWSPIVKNINSVLPELLPLLSNAKPDYINNFAAESFAFVARKVRDKSQFLMLSLKNVNNNQDELAGMAKLLFEVIKSVGNQFHSGAEEFLTIMLEQLSNKMWSKLLFIICENLVRKLISFISGKTDVSPIWKSFTKVGNIFLTKWQENYDEYNSENLTMLLKLIEPLVTSREVILRNPEELKIFVLNLATCDKIRSFKPLHTIVIDIASYLLTNEHYFNKILNTDETIRQILGNINDKQLSVRFCEKVIQLPQYEFLILNEFLKFVHLIGFDEYLLRFLAKVIWMKTKFVANEDDTKIMNFYSVCFKSISDSFITFLLDCIPEKNCVLYPDKLENILSAILVLSYVETCRVSFIPRVDAFMIRLCTIMDDIRDAKRVAEFLYVLFMTFQYRMKCDNNITFNCDIIIKFVMKFVNSSNYLCSLRILDTMFLSSEFKCLYTDDDKLHLINNLCSPFHKVRLFTLQVLKKINIHPVFENLLLIESIVPSIETYREKLQLLQKLECNEYFMNHLQDKLVRIAVLKFLFGNLYINFQYMWEPTQKLILSHMENNEDVWQVIECHLQEAVMNDINSLKLMEDFATDLESDFLKEHFYDLNGVDDRPDFYNFRCLLLDVLTSLRNFSLTNKCFILDLFLKFYTSEYTSSILEYRLFTNIKKLEIDLVNENGLSDESSAILNNENKNLAKNLNRLFIIYLKLINNVSGQIPSKLKSQLFDIHFDQLSNGNSEIQQLSLTYICRAKGLTAYRDRLLLLTKENTMKDQMLNIRIDFNSENFPDQDKSRFMEIVLKILYGKIRKKCAPQLRDSIFEFLAGCEVKEIISFFDMFFKQFSGAANDTTSVLYHKEEINLRNVISPSCLSSYVNIVLELLKRCGKSLKDTCLAYLLRVMFKIVANLIAILNKKSEVHSGYYGLLNKIRVTSFETIIYFIDEFEYSWTENEISVFLNLFVEPWIEKVPEECLQSPNPVMKLFITFTKNTRYFPLLAKKCENLSPLDVIMNLLNSEKVYFNVKNIILEIIERLLTLEEDENSVEISDLMYLDTVTKLPLKEVQHYGKALLLPYVGTILEYLQKQLSKKYIKLEGMYMLILKRISEYALNEESSVRLLTLLIPVLRSKATADDDVVLPLLDTIFNLFKTFKNYDNFESYLLEIGYLFHVVCSPSVRRILCDLIVYISRTTGTKFVDAVLIRGLNLVDKKWLDQPDYAGRLEAFKNINKSCENGELNLYTGVFVIYNCFHMIKKEKDMALRDHSGLCMKKICPALCEKYSKSKAELDILLNVVLLPLIKEGIQANNENHQQESIMLLGHLVRECHSLHPVFRDLYVLSDKLDIENDFFENIQHLQHYRRIKALKRFTELMSNESKVPQPYSLTFVLPLISQCLLSSKYSSEHGLVNCAIDALKVVCHLSSWRHYERILKQFILEMRKNMSLRKQGIRIVSAILDSFHFDISQAEIKTIPGHDLTKNKKKQRNVNNIEDNDETMDVDEIAVESVNSEDLQKPFELPVKRINVLCRSDAARVYRSIKSFLIPSLDRSFMTYEDSDQYHKLSKKGSRDDKEEMAVLSIPIAFAVVKLLKRLPRTLLDEYISTVFLKLSTYLKSRLPSIRKVARETMQNIIVEVGPSYFSRLLSEMMAILTKGFQIHVLVSTTHAVLEKMEHLLSESDIDNCIDPILEICIVDLFGKVAEEKEVEKISNKIPEARGNISYNMLRILAEYISEGFILDLVLPLKEILSTNMSGKTVNKVRRCLHYIATGLTHNKFITSESLLVFSYGVSNDCIPSLVAERENNKIRIEPEVPVKKLDSLLIPEEPRHMHAEKRQICSRTNAHVIIAFGLELLTFLLKRETSKSSRYRPHLDPFVPLINDCLQSQHTELITLSLKCLTRLLKSDLPSLNQNVSNISDSVFLLLGKYSTTGITGENAELLMATTKVAQVLIHDLKHQINNHQLRILLFVVEDLQKNRSHYATGFSLLDSIIGRKFNIPEFHQLMQTTAELSIKSYSDDIRYKARKAFYNYLMYYPHGKKLRQHVLFYTSQLKYEELHGRMSALEMLKYLIHVFPSNVFAELSLLLYVQLAFRLIQDDSPECKKMASDCLSDIISRIQGTKEGTEVFSITLLWMKEKKTLNRKLAVQLLGIFASAEKEKFMAKLDSVLPLMQDQLCDRSTADEPGKYVKAPILEDCGDNVSISQKDQLIFQVLQFYKTFMQICPDFLQNKEYASHVRQIGESCQLMLRHSHEWVRLETAHVLRIIFKSMNALEISSILNRKLPFESGFLRGKDAKTQIKSLCLDLCDQLAPGSDIMEQLLKTVVINLLFLAEVLQNVDDKNLSLLWLVKKVAKQTSLEISRTPQKYSVRAIVFNWFDALAMKLESDKLAPLLPVVMKPILRELSTTDEQGLQIRRMAKEVKKDYCLKIKDHDEIIVKVQTNLNIKRAKRKTQIAQMVVTDPERAAKRKMKIQLKKKEQKKRRLEKLRKRKFKSGKKKTVEIIND